MLSLSTFKWTKGLYSPNSSSYINPSYIVPSLTTAATLGKM